MMSRNEMFLTAVNKIQKDGAMKPKEKVCTYPRCKCIVSTSTMQPEPVCPKKLPRCECGGKGYIVKNIGHAGRAATFNCQVCGIQLAKTQERET